MSSILARFRRSTPPNIREDLSLAHSRDSPESNRSSSDVSPPHKDIEKSEVSKDEKSQKASGMLSGGNLGPTVSNQLPAEAKVDVVLAHQNDGDIKYRTMSWQKCAAILFGEYVCLAILSFPWAFATLGMAGGILATFGLGLIALYTSMVR